MKRVLRLELSLSENTYHLTEHEIHRHRDNRTPYETVAMIKGYQIVDGEDKARRVYKNKLGIPHVYTKPHEILSLDKEFGFVYTWEKDKRAAKIALLDAFRSQLRMAEGLAESFMDECSVLEGEVTEAMKYS